MPLNWSLYLPLGAVVVGPLANRDHKERKTPEERENREGNVVAENTQAMGEIF